MVGLRNEFRDNGDVSVWTRRIALPGIRSFSKFRDCEVNETAKLWREAVVWCVDQVQGPGRVPVTWQQFHKAAIAQG